MQLVSSAQNKVDKFEWTNAQHMQVIRAHLTDIKLLNPDPAQQKNKMVTGEHYKDLSQSQRDTIMDFCGNMSRFTSCYSTLRLCLLPDRVFKKFVLVDKMFTENQMKGQKTLRASKTKYRRKKNLRSGKQKKIQSITATFWKTDMMSGLTLKQVESMLDQVINLTLSMAEWKNKIKVTKEWGKLTSALAYCLREDSWETCVSKYPNFLSAKKLQAVLPRDGKLVFATQKELSAKKSMPQKIKHMTSKLPIGIQGILNA
jgi:hypothetical protein